MRADGQDRRGRQDGPDARLQSGEFAERPAWRGEALGLAALALGITLLFWSGSVDIAVARWFYLPEGADHWPLARKFPWTLLYRAATWLTAGLIVAGLAALALSVARAYRHWRRAALLVLLAVAIGPGLLGNAIFKDHWQHPRPRELIELGGSSHYVPSPLIGSEGGASFPCGHCTVGFLYGCGWWIWRRRRPALAATSLAVGLSVGMLLGVGRLAAGAHFLSDIIWSALLAFGVVEGLDYGVLRQWGRASARDAPASGGQTPRAPHAPHKARAPRAQGALAIAAVAGGVAVLLALFVTPHGVAISERVPLGMLTAGSAPRSLDVEADVADVDIELLDAPAAELAIDGELHGFGLPGSRLGAHLERQPRPPTLHYRIEERGWLTDVDGSVTLRVPAAAFARVRVAVLRGNIRVRDLTATEVVRSQRLQLELHTDHGRIESPAGARTGQRG